MDNDNEQKLGRYCVSFHLLNLVFCPYFLYTYIQDEEEDLIKILITPLCVLLRDKAKQQSKNERPSGIVPSALYSLFSLL